MATTKEQTVQITVKVSRSDYESLQRLSSKQYRPLAEIVRGFIKDGMDITRSKDDIDFIRQQLREELGLALKPQLGRLAKMMMRVGMMTIAFCYFNSKLVHMFVPFRERGISYEEMLSECKCNAAAYLNIRDVSVDAAMKDFEESDR
jgi:hypothetical protein